MLDVVNGEKYRVVVARYGVGGWGPESFLLVEGDSEDS